MSLFAPRVVTETERPGQYGPEAPVPVFQHVWEFARLLDLYRERKPKRVLEIGTYHGGTLYHWLQNAAKGATIVSVDSYAVGVDNRTLYPAWTPAGVTLHAFEGDSHNPATVTAVTAHAPFDWIFIDADHYIDAVRQDWETYGPLATADGIIAFHDILTNPVHPEIEVEILWRELQAQGYVTQELVADRNAVWGGIGVVYLP